MMKKSMSQKDSKSVLACKAYPNPRLLATQNFHIPSHINLNKFHLSYSTALHIAFNNSWHNLSPQRLEQPKEMESLIKQTRSRFVSNKEDRSSSTTDKRIPPQKTQDFREKKRSQSWMKKQVSRQMSWEYDFNSCEYPTAIAAAAYAVQTLAESSSWDKRDRDYGNDKSRSRDDEREEKPEPLKSALKSSDGISKSSFNDESSSKRLSEKRPTKKISFADMDEISNEKAEKPPLQKAPPSLKKPPSFADHQLNMGGGGRPELHPPPGPSDAAADAWEKEEMISIKERYEKLRTTIDNWEMKKKKKAMHKRETTEDEMDEKRKAKNMKKYKSEIARIEEIADGARAQAAENRRNEELKVKEKANRIRATGKMPPTCFCF